MKEPWREDERMSFEREQGKYVKERIDIEEG